MLLPFKDYPVSADWVTNLLQSQKMIYAEARVELAKIVKGIDRNMIRIEKWQGEATAAALEDHISMVSAQLAAMKRPFEEIPIVQLWASHYEVLRGRCKFLALEGPSCYGKTQFAKGLCRSHSQFLEVDCSSCVEPLLKDYRALVHEVILFDEATPKIVVRSNNFSRRGHPG